MHTVLLYLCMLVDYLGKFASAALVVRGFETLKVDRSNCQGVYWLSVRVWGMSVIFLERVLVSKSMA